MLYGTSINTIDTFCRSIDMYRYQIFFDTLTSLAVAMMPNIVSFKKNVKKLRPDQDHRNGREQVLRKQTGFFREFKKGHSSPLPYKFWRSQEEMSFTLTKKKKRKPRGKVKKYSFTRIRWNFVEKFAIFWRKYYEDAEINLSETKKFEKFKGKNMKEIIETQKET